MQRREFLKTAAAGAVASGAPLSRPNFLFLIADDLTFRGIHALGNPEIRTPNLDSLVRRGCTFTHCFHQGSWSGAVCIASRTMLNTGLTAFRARRLAETTPLWGETLGASGYHTRQIGKWHLSDANLKRGFQQSGPVSGGMFESGPDAYGRPAPGNLWTPWDTSLKGQWLDTRVWQTSAPPGIRHSAQIWAEHTADALKQFTADPHFLYVGFNSPHDPRQAPKEFLDLYPQERVRVPPNYLPQHPFDQGDARGRDERLAPFPRTRAAVQLHRSEYLAHITYMDVQIGRILEALRQSPEADRTYVIFTADHGLAVGQHGLMGKQNLYDHSVRMPLIVAGPGIPANRRVDHLVYQHSLFATTCELAGVAAPPSVEFPSLAGLLHGDRAAPHDAVFSYYLNYQRSVRTADHKLIVYPEARVTQLFDLHRDPWETRSLADSRQHSALRRELLERLHRFQKELDDPLPPVAAA